MNKLLFTLILVATSFILNAQVASPQYFEYSRKDSLRGGNSNLKSSYDLSHYHLDVFIDPVKESIKGKNTFNFSVVNNLTQLQFDLYDYLNLEKIVYHGKSLKFTREYNAVIVDFPATLKKGSHDSLTVYYNSFSKEKDDFAKVRAFSSRIDANGKPWMSTSCQGSGASTWWPSKEDGGADEVDSMLISITVPKGFVNVSNGRLKKTTTLKNGDVRFDWYINSPINNYCVSANIGDYISIKDSFKGEKGNLDIEYWVLKENKKKAKAYFPDQVKNMLTAFEHWFGPYPFYEDSYKLVDATYVGMEHQSAITYGNEYKFGYSRWKTPDISKTGHGLKFDYIIIHESGHEWFGNSITAKDVADWWIHESFTTYSEALYIDYHFGKKASQEYVHGQRMEIANDMPVQGPYGVNRSGSKDKYFKGAVLLNMIRSIINDDEKWRSILRGMGQRFYHQTTDYNEVVDYISEQADIDLKPVFEQYLKKTSIPTLELRKDEGKYYVRWISEIYDFNMPVAIRVKGKEYQLIKPSTKWMEIPFNVPSLEDIEVDTFNFYIGVLKQ